MIKILNFEKAIIMVIFTYNNNNNFKSIIIIFTYNNKNENNFL